MRTERIEVYADGHRLITDVRAPDGPGPFPAIVLCPGMSLTKEVWLPAIAETLVRRGFLTLIPDYRTFGESEGHPRRRLLPAQQVRDVQACLSALAQRTDVEEDRLGLYGTSLGAAVAVGTATEDDRVGAVVATAGPMDLTRVWTAFDGFPAFRAKVRAARRVYAATGEVTRISVARLLAGDPETAAYLVEEAPHYPRWDLEVSFESLEDLFSFRPERDIERTRAAIQWIQPGGDALIAGGEARSAYARAVGPRSLVWLDDCAHVDIYRDAAVVERVATSASDWFDAWL